MKIYESRMFYDDTGLIGEIYVSYFITVNSQRDIILKVINLS